MACAQGFGVVLSRPDTCVRGNSVFATLVWTRMQRVLSVHVVSEAAEVSPTRRGADGAAGALLRSADGAAAGDKRILGIGMDSLHMSTPSAIPRMWAHSVWAVSGLCRFRDVSGATRCRL